MKIIRKRSGFTTNSSGSSDWVPPETDPALEQDLPSGTESQTLMQDQPEILPNLPTWSKPLISIGIVGLIVAGLFLLERLVRKIWKRIKRAKSEDQPE
jgi:hypothetical protein